MLSTLEPMPTMLLLPPVVEGLSDVFEPHHKAAIVDIWGVLHNGKDIYPHAIETLRRMRDAGIVICLLSNAPRRVSTVANRLAAMGLSPGLYHYLVTSGELVFEAFSSDNHPDYASFGKRYLHVGPPELAGLLAGLDLQSVDIGDQPDFVLCTGNDATLDRYAWQVIAARDLPMICANPDLTVDVGDEVVVCAGTVAAHYTALGGRVFHHGKPHLDTYRRVSRWLGQDAASVVAIGDALATDIAGANGAGMTSVLIAGGIHKAELGIQWGETPSKGRLEIVFGKSAVVPTFVSPTLRW